MEKTVEYHYHPEQKEVFKDNTRYKVIACGRRWGKTRGAITWLMLKLANKGEEVRIGWWVAPTYSQAKIAFRYFKELYSDLIQYKNETELRVKLWNGNILEFKSADNPDNLRGIGIAYLVVDESATIKEDVWKEVLRPALMDTSGEVCFIGTPKGMNWFYELKLRGEDEQEKDFKFWQFGTSGNPYINKDEIKKAQQEMPERLYSQEILAAFIEDVGGVFRNVRGCAIGKREASQYPKYQYLMGVDLGKYQDFTVITVIRKDNGSVVGFDRFKDINWELQEQRIIAIAEQYKATVLMDKGQVGDRVLESIQGKYGNIEGIMFNNENKSAMINKLSNYIEKGLIKYPNITELINELRIYEYEQLPSGKLRMNAPSGYHDDCVISLALACWDLQLELDIVGSVETAGKRTFIVDKEDDNEERTFSKKQW